MIKVKRIINNNNWKLKADDEITLDSLDRNRRRIALITKKKVAFLLDQKKTIFLNNGALLVLSNEYKVKVKAKLEEVLKVETNTKQNLSVLAWHIGNRHIPAEIHNNYILIKRDAIGLKCTGCGVGIDALGSPISAALITPPIHTISGLTPKNPRSHKQKSALFPSSIDPT